MIIKYDTIDESIVEWSHDGKEHMRADIDELIEAYEEKKDAENREYEQQMQEERSEMGVRK